LVDYLDWRGFRLLSWFAVFTMRDAAQSKCFASNALVDRAESRRILRKHYHE